MAIVFWGQTKCALCGRPILEGDDIISIPPVVQNKADLLYEFNDQIYHKACLLGHNLWPSLKKLLTLVEQASGNVEKRCKVCDKLIDHPDGYLSLGFLSLNEHEILSRFNFFEFHRDHFKQWDERQVMLDRLAMLKEEGRWVGDTLDYLFVIK